MLVCKFFDKGVEVIFGIYDVIFLFISYIYVFRL